MKFKALFGRIISIPTLILIFAINYSGWIDLGNIDLKAEISFILLFVLIVLILLLTINFYGSNQKVFLIFTSGSGNKKIHGSRDSFKDDQGWSGEYLLIA